MWRAPKARVYHRAACPEAGEERRGAARIPVEMWVEETTGSERYFRRAGNLSRGGLRLEHTIPLPVGTSVNLTFTLPGDKMPDQRSPARSSRRPRPRICAWA